jgi:hypothetical protein
MTRKEEIVILIAKCMENTKKAAEDYYTSDIKKLLSNAKKINTYSEELSQYVKEYEDIEKKEFENFKLNEY